MIAFAIILVVIGTILLVLASPRKGGDVAIEHSDLKANLPELTGWAKIPAFIVGLTFIGVGVWIGVFLFIQSLPPPPIPVQAQVSSTQQPEPTTTSTIQSETPTGMGVISATSLVSPIPTSEATEASIAVPTPTARTCGLGRVKVPNLLVREGPGVSQEVVHGLPEGTVVDIIVCDSETRASGQYWVKVRTVLPSGVVIVGWVPGPDIQ